MQRYKVKIKLAMVCKFLQQVWHLGPINIGKKESTDNALFGGRTSYKT